MRSFQYAAGGYYTGVKGWEFSLESYYKDMYNVLEYQDGATFFGSSGGWQEKVEMGRGRSFGLEILAQKTIGKTTGWLGYTIAKSDRRFKDGTVNNGERFPYKYDRPPQHQSLCEPCFQQENGYRDHLDFQYGRNGYGCRTAYRDGIW